MELITEQKSTPSVRRASRAISSASAPVLKRVLRERKPLLPPPPAWLLNFSTGTGSAGHG